MDNVNRARILSSIRAFNQIEPLWLTFLAVDSHSVSIRLCYVILNLSFNQHWWAFCNEIEKWCKWQVAFIRKSVGLIVVSSCEIEAEREPVFLVPLLSKLLATKLLLNRWSLQVTEHQSFACLIFISTRIESKMYANRCFCVCICA